MRILHLADLHLGKTLQEQSLLEDQEYMLKQIIEKIKKYDIETILISGDIYDRSVPQKEAVNLLDNFLNTLVKELKKKVFIIAGNHDSKERLGFGNRIFEDDGLYIESRYTGTLKKVQLEDEYGKLNIYMLPYIKPVEVKKYFESSESQQENKKQIEQESKKQIERENNSESEIIQNSNSKEEKEENEIENSELTSCEQTIHKIIEKEEINEKERNIILVHQFVTADGKEPERTDSEVISLGGTDNVDISNFDKFDYVAIGHVHRPQRIGRDTARYAGTMLKYSFSEVNHKKSMPILDFKEKGNIQINLEELTPLRDMREIKGPIEKLIKKENYEGTNTDDYMRVILTNEEPIYDAIGQIRRIYPNTLKLEIRNSKTALNLEEEESKLENVRNKSEIELFNEFYKMQNNSELNEKQKEYLQKIIKEVKEKT